MSKTKSAPDTSPKQEARATPPKSTDASAPKPPSRLDQLEKLLSAPGGASIAEMVEATGWQQHSVRGAMAGALKKKRGLTITSEKIDGVRRYCAEKPA
ncbi:DUF3489 domain-containing protein [Qipengyuania sp. SM2507]